MGSFQRTTIAHFARRTLACKCHEPLREIESIHTHTRRCTQGKKCVRRQSGSRLPSMVVVHLQICTCRTFPFMRAKRTRRWHISKSTSHGACNGDVTLAPGVGKRGASARPCSHAADAELRSFAAQITQRCLRKMPRLSLWTGRHKDFCRVLSK